MARRAVNLHGCALPHCAPLLRRLRPKKSPGTGVAVYLPGSGPSDRIRGGLIACSFAPCPSPCSGSTRFPWKWRPTSPTGCPPTPSWGSPEARSGKATTGSVPPCAIPDSPSPAGRSPSTLRRPICGRTVPFSTCRSPCRCCPRRASCRERRWPGGSSRGNSLSTARFVRSAGPSPRRSSRGTFGSRGSSLPSTTGTRRAWCPGSGWSRSVPSARRRPPSRARNLPAMAQTPIPGTARRRSPAPPLPSALPISRTWSVNRWRGGPSRSRRRGATRCSSWGRRDAGRRCSPSACPESSQTSRRRRPSTRRASTERPGNRPGPALSSAGRSGRLTRRSPRPVCWAEETRHGRARSPSLTAVCFSSTNSPNSAPRSGRRSGSRSNRERSGSRDPATGTGSRAGSCCWRPPTRARAATRATPGRSAGAPRRSWTGSRESFRGPSSTGSTSRSPCFRSRSRHGPARRAANRPRRSGAGSTPAGRFRRRGTRGAFPGRTGPSAPGPRNCCGLTPEATAFSRGRRNGSPCREGRSGRRAAWRGRSPTWPPSAARGCHVAEALQYRLSGTGIGGSG